MYIYVWTVNSAWYKRFCLKIRVENDILHSYSRHSIIWTFDNLNLSINQAKGCKPMLLISTNLQFNNLNNAYARIIEHRLYLKLNFFALVDEWFSGSGNKSHTHSSAIKVRRNRTTGTFAYLLLLRTQHSSIADVCMLCSYTSMKNECYLLPVIFSQFIHHTRLENKFWSEKDFSKNPI